MSGFRHCKLNIDADNQFDSCLITDQIGAMHDFFLVAKMQQI